METMELGGNIELVGFQDVGSAELIVLKKIIGSYARKFSDMLNEDYEKLVVNLKPIHGKKSSKFEVHVKLLVKGKPVTSEITENNLFVSIADSLKKIEAQVIKN